jgi:glycosyltransferase involved in cell wall biosynthesis
VLKAVLGLSEEYKWILCFYNQYTEPYYTRIREMADSHQNVLVLEDLSPREFSWVLGRASVYFRPTVTDGDSVALREALAKGVRCVASDVVPRPGCVDVFRLGDEEEMFSRLREASEGAASDPAVEVGGLTIIDLYRRILALGGAMDA